MTPELTAPFVWFGGKRRVAVDVWRALGPVDNYVEPFGGSLAVLLARPKIAHPSARIAETVNDADGMVANFWRACRSDPEAVARYASDPVNETDLIARHLWLVNTGRDRLDRLEADPDYYDAKVAGWWVWGVNAWIGSGWCSANGPWHLAPDGQSVRQLPHLGSAGQGVNRQLPHLGDAGKGHNRFDTAADVVAYMQVLAARLARVRVCAGDWSRVVTRGALNYGSTVGVFLDPPYLGDVRTSDLYACDDHSIANDVRQWALDNGDDPRLRIVLAGYSNEHDHLMSDTWGRIRWTAGASYSTTASADAQSGNHERRDGECLWLSPACRQPDAQLDLFATQPADNQQEAHL